MPLRLPRMPREVVAAPRRGVARLPDCCGDCAVVAALAEAHDRLVLAEDGDVDVRSEEGLEACRRFVRELGAAADRLSCDIADRSYREAFSRNYRILFPDRKRCYRMDVLEACVEQLDSFWVNGEQYTLSEDTLTRGGAMLAAWRRLGGCLQVFRVRGGHVGLAMVTAAISALDLAWADFEQHYIRELIRIEEGARSIIVEAIELDRRLRRVERSFGVAAVKSHEARRGLAACVARLNSVANNRRKGRDDLRSEVLEAAYETLSRTSDEQDASLAVAHHVVGAFQALREYFRGASSCLRRLDPYLSNNAGLVERLAAWEEAWEVGHRYLSSPLREAFGSMVSSIARTKDQEPAFASMCDGCHPDVFLVLPRLMWLAFLGRPSEHAALLRSVLPEAFAEEGGEAMGQDLAAFVEGYRRLGALLGARGADVQATLLSKAIGVEGQTMDGLEASEREAIRSFMLDLERWSMAAQRACPEDWNSCAAAVLRVLAGAWAPEAQAPQKFRI